MAATSDFVQQAAAIPLQGPQVCLVTSSTGKRWVIPKGLIDPGDTAAECATKEAWEEAGLVGVLDPEPVGRYVYSKWSQAFLVTVFRMRVTEVHEDWPERNMRRRIWVSFGDAVARVADSGLRKVLRAALTP